MNRKKLFSYKLLAVLICFLCILFIGRKLGQSLFFNPKDRIQILFYDVNTRIYSFGNSDGIHYFISFDPDTKMRVPGGYGLYRIGGLRKLIDLQKDSDILKRTFSIGISSYVPYIFYSQDSMIYYSDSKEEIRQTLPNFKDFFLSRSHVAFFDKLYLYFRFIGKKQNDFTEIDARTKIVNEDKIFLDDVFSKTYIGYFYQRRFRQEQKTIQLLYESHYQTALYISRLIEGNGIRVNDLTQKKVSEKGCYIIESTSDYYSQTAISLSEFFSCPIKKGRTEISDIIIYLGDIEKKWEVFK